MSDIILSIDQGTTGTTCLVVQCGAQVRILGRGYHELPQHFVKPGWVEHDLHEIWQSVSAASKQALGAANLPGKAIACIGITNQRETTCAWDQNGNPLHRAIVWQDRRTAPLCRELTDGGHASLVRQRTGLLLDPYFSGTKLLWLMRNVPQVAQAVHSAKARVGTVDSWVAFKLTGHKAHVTDVTNASRTLLFDIHRNCWDQDLCKLMGPMPMEVLPQVHANTAAFGTTLDLDFLPDGVPICGVAGDQHAALFGQGCVRPGMAKCTYGTGAFALVNTGARVVQSTRGLLSTIAWQHAGLTQYALEGSVFVAGALVQWLRDGLGLIKHSHEVEALAKSVPDNGGVVVVPALTGLGAPHWRADARGLICGITRGTTRGHIARAALEGIALQVFDLCESMRLDSGAQIKTLRVDGGAAANDMLMQMQADYLGIDIERPAMVESTALGAAFFAALGAGIYSDIDAIEKAWSADRRFTPNADREHVSTLLAHWHSAVLRA